MKRLILPTILLFVTVLFLSSKVDAQADVQYCQNEYNARRSSCIANDNKCSAGCGENQACWDACNKERNSCDEAAVAWQKECLGLNTNNQEMPVVDSQSAPVVPKTAPKPRPSVTPKVQDLQPGKLPAQQGAWDDYPEKQDETWMSITFISDEIRQKSQEINQWIENNLGEFDTKRIEKETRDSELYGRTPQMTDQIIRQAQEEWEKATKDVGFFDTESFPLEWRPIIEQHLKPGTQIVSGDDYTAIFRPDGGTVLFYPNSYGVFVVEKTYNLTSGEVEVKTDIAPVNIKSIKAYIKARGTHYRVSYNPENKETVVEIYEGEVEITTNDGKTVNISPNGDESGIVVISYKLSPIKLATSGFVLVAVLGGMVFILKKKILSKGKKKR